jgi:predicted nucleic acid-binding protein
MLLDSNILIYAAEPGGVFLSRWVEDGTARITSVMRIEVLGFPQWHLLDEVRPAKLVSLVGSLPELPLDDRVAKQAIELRRQKKMMLADAIIAASALTHRIPLVTRNEDDFAHMRGLEIVNPFRQASQT